MTAARKVVFLRQQLLPVSETFVRAQAGSLSRWRASLVGLARTTPSLDLSAVEHRSLFGAPAGPLRARLARLAARTGLDQAWLAQVLRRERADVLHVHFGVDLVRLWPALRHFSCPIVVTLHGYDIQVDTAWWDRGTGGADLIGYHARLAEIARRPNVHIVAVSQAIRRRALAVGLPDARLRVQHIGIDVRAFDPAPLPAAQRPPRVLFVGRLAEKKGLPLLLQAAARARQGLAALQLRVVGDGEGRDRYQALAAELGLDCHFTGALDAAGVRTELAAARLLCLPSITAGNGDAEGLGMVLLEAQCAGVPVLTSARAGIEEGMLDGVTGCAFDEGDVERLATLLHELLPDGARLDRMAAAARRYVREHHELGACCAELERFYDGLVDGRQAPAATAGWVSPPRGAGS
ncbi:glycosyltransferase [Rubrivivax gelatinosus]|nr:glycosyltransferase [Rubrivivax gelatinosus]